jgi:hypothetical protein
VKGSAHTTEHLIRDWEELPDSPHIDFAWETLIDTLLNGDSKPLRVQPGRGLFGEDTVVWNKIKAIDICDVVVGDYIKDKTGFTKVIGVYNDSELVPRSGPNRSVWYWSPIKKRWIHPHIEECVPRGYGFHLITESGTFLVGFTRPGVREQSKMLVRDFTEVGATRIHETYAFTAASLIPTINLHQS